jgi:hypothetical protein
MDALLFIILNIELVKLNYIDVFYPDYLKRSNGDLFKY